MGSGFQDTGRFSHLPKFGMKLGHWPKFQKLHIHSLSTPGSRNWLYFRPTGSGFQDTGQLPHLGMKLGHWPMFQKLHLYTFPNKVFPVSQISLLFALRAPFFQIIKVFDFSVGYNGEFELGSGCHNIWKRQNEECCNKSKNIN